MDKTTKMAENTKKDVKVAGERISNLEKWAIGHTVYSKWLDTRVKEIHKWCEDMDG